MSPTDARAGAPEPSIPDLPVRYFRSSDREVVKAQRADFCDEATLQSDRQEGHFAVSFRSAHGWVAISKDVLMDFPGAGRDARIVGLPSEAREVLSLMCPGLIEMTTAETGKSQ
jgi:hypothetical protein